MISEKIKAVRLGQYFALCIQYGRIRLFNTISNVILTIAVVMINFWIFLLFFNRVNEKTTLDLLFIDLNARTLITINNGLILHLGMFLTNCKIIVFCSSLINEYAMSCLK